MPENNRLWAKEVLLILTFLPIVCEFFSILLVVIMDVMLAVNNDSRIAPANIHTMLRIRANIDLGALSPYLKQAEVDGQFYAIFLKDYCHTKTLKLNLLLAVVLFGKSR